MNISYDYYRIFYYIAKYKSISKAAEELLANQSNLSRTLKNLELQLGCSLFLRTHMGMKLTKEGETLFSHIRVAFEHIELGESEITRRNNPDCGSIFIAASEVALRCLSQDRAELTLVSHSNFLCNGSKSLENTTVFPA